MLSEKLCEVLGVLFRISHIVLRTTLHNTIFCDRAGLSREFAVFLNWRPGGGPRPARGKFSVSAVLNPHQISLEVENGHGILKILHPH